MHHQRLWKGLDLLWGPTASRNHRVLYWRKAGWVYLSGWDVKTLRMVKAASLSFLLLGRMLMLCLHICKYKICSVLWLEKRGWELCQVNCLSPTGAPEGSTEGCFLNADPSAVEKGPVCWPVVWGSFAAFHGLWSIMENLQRSLWLSDYCCLLFHVEITCSLITVQTWIASNMTHIALEWWWRA